MDKPNDIEPVKIPVEDVLDLHTFLPSEIPSLLEEYLKVCGESKIYSVRIIHGKGKGVLKNLVRGLLKKLPMVESFSDAPPSAGAWGATTVELRREVNFDSPQWAQILSRGAKAMGTHLRPEQIKEFALHAKELLAWNKFANLTAITDPAEIAEKHFLDTLPLSSIVPKGSGVLDIGSGGGIPGIPLKVIRPDLHLCLIDASRKKVNFLTHVIRMLSLSDIEVRQIRAEELAKEHPGTARQYSAVISRAASKLGTLLDQALPLLHRPGLIIAMKGASVAAELQSIGARVKTERISVNTKPYRLPGLGIQRTLIVLSKK